MRIAYVCADPGIPLRGVKGASVHLRSLAAALAHRGNEVLLACARVEGVNPLPAGVRVIELPAKDQGRWLRDEFAAAGIESVLERYSLPGGAALEAARSLRLPFTLEVNAPLADEAARFRGLEDVEFWRGRERRLIAEADCVLVVSTALRSHAVAAGTRSESVFLIPNGVQLDLFRRRDGNEVRRRLGFDSAVVVGFVGSLKPWHGVGLLLDAFAALPVSYRLLLVGEGPEREALQKRARALGLTDRVVFAGAVPHANVPDYLLAMDIAVAPFAPMDGFYFSPLKVAEYLAAGLPVVASHQGDLPSVVGDAGLLYPAGSGGALTAALRRLGEDAALRRRMGRAAIARAESLDWTLVAARIEEVLATALGQETRS